MKTISGEGRCLSCGCRTSYEGLCERCLEIQERRERNRAQSTRIILIPVTPLYLLWHARRTVAGLALLLGLFMCLAMAASFGHLSHYNLHFLPFDVRVFWAAQLTLTLGLWYVIQLRAARILRYRAGHRLSGARLWPVLNWIMMLQFFWVLGCLWGSFNVPPPLKLS